MRFDQYLGKDERLKIKDQVQGAGGKVGGNAQSEALGAKRKTEGSSEPGNPLNTRSAEHSPLCILRHDVDSKPENSLATAEIESEMVLQALITLGSFRKVLMRK